MMVFSKDAVNGCWKWGSIYSLPIVSSLGIDYKPSARMRSEG